jgi:hypothetical protein
MAHPSRIDISTLTAFDVHVHLEHTGGSSATDEQATKSFKGVQRGNQRRWPTTTDRARWRS